METNIFYGGQRALVSPALAAKWPWIRTAVGNKRKRRPEVDDAQLLGIRLRNDWLQTKAQVDDALAVHYLEVLPSHVPERRRARAQVVVEKVAASFNMPTPSIEWFSEETYEEKKVRRECGDPFEGFTMPEPILGFASKSEGKIGLHAHLADENLTRVAVHEVLHLGFPEASENQIKEYETRICSGS